MPAGTPSLRTRLLLGGTPLVAVAVGAGALLTGRTVRTELERAARDGLQRAAVHAAVMTDGYVGQRAADLALLARLPQVVEAARRAGAEARRLGLDRRSTEDLEAAYRGRTLLTDPGLTAFLRDTRAGSDFVEIFFTERLGFTALATNPTSDFVQSDEAWWQAASDGGTYVGDPAFDESAGTIALELAARIADPVSGEPLGVIKGVVPVSQLAGMLARASGTASTAEVLDSAGAVVFSADTARLLRRLPDAAARDLVAAVPVQGGRWRVEVREPAASALAAARAMERAVYIAAGAALLLFVGMVIWVTNWLNRRVTRPVTVAGSIASRVADGDLSVAVAGAAGGSKEVAHLLAAVQTMVAALRRLVGQIRASSEESAAMAQEISASTQQMSASTQEMADTCQSLSSLAAEQAELVRAASQHAEGILGIATRLAAGARTTAERNAQLREIAGEHRARLIEGGDELARLATDLEEGAADAARLAELSSEIEQFVRQAQAIASHTNMLALNAAIEASRAGGGEGRGFAVVADEVRKLAAQAARAAATTSETVHTVLASVQATHDRLTRLARSSAAVRNAARAAAGGLEEVAGAAAETATWTDEISHSAAEVRQLVEEISQRLRNLAGGTESVVAAAEQIAAAAEEQSASTQEIAGSAAQLAEASEKLTVAVSTFRLNGQAKPGERRARAP